MIGELEVCLPFADRLIDIGDLATRDTGIGLLLEFTEALLQIRVSVAKEVQLTLSALLRFLLTLTTGLVLFAATSTFIIFVLVVITPAT